MLKNDIKLSKSFKVHAKKAILAILFFVFVFLLITIVALGFTALCAYFGLMIIFAAPHI